jgi:TRAP-type C4-dicarboxylate transport system permease small subunit
MPEPTERWRSRISVTCGLIASVFLGGMLLLTVSDVVLRALSNRPIPGVYDLIELFLAGTFFFALPCVFLRDENILVNSIDDLAPRWVPMLKRAANLLALVMLVLMAWQGLIAARDSYEFHDVTGDLGLSRAWHWLVLLIGVIGSALAALAMALRREERPEA